VLYNLRKWKLLFFVKNYKNEREEIEAQGEKYSLKIFFRMDKTRKMQGHSSW